MINPGKLYERLKTNEIEMFAGVPDSLLKDFCAFITSHSSQDEHVITANEGNAVALAAGHYLGSNKPALVYMQNSGLGNIINPLTSLADREVYSIPMLLMIGWRGEPGIKDEPQHVKQGRVTTQTLEALEIPWFHLPPQEEEAIMVLDEAISKMKSTSAPVAILISKGTFQPYNLEDCPSDPKEISRECAITEVVANLTEKDFVVSTTGMASRELFEIREQNNQGHSNDFLTVGAMGHTSSIALGLAMSRTNSNIVCLDGDGSLLMHMGSLPIIGAIAPRNLTHIVINNGAHDSVGGQPTVGFSTELCNIASASGYANAYSTSSKKEIKEALHKAKTTDGLSFIEIVVEKGSRKDLGRPTTSPLENKSALMRALQQAGAHSAD